MTELPNSCPTCFEGRCPNINTTPDVPEPDDARINAAMRVIPDILSEQFKIADRFEAVASRLLEHLLQPEYGAHRMPAAKWAVHRLIDQKMLSVHEGRIGLREASVEKLYNREWKGNRFVRIVVPRQRLRTAPQYGDEPVAFDNFMVRAEKSLWQFWRSLDNSLQEPGHTANSTRNTDSDDVSPEQNQIYRMDQLCEELGVTSRTVRKYAKEVGIRFTGKRNHQFTPEQRLAIYQQVADNAPIRQAKIARGLLENGNAAGTQ
jgi:hypothetical protein